MIKNKDPIEKATAALEEFIDTIEEMEKEYKKEVIKHNADIRKIHKNRNKDKKYYKKEPWSK